MTMEEYRRALARIKTHDVHYIWLSAVSHYFRFSKIYEKHECVRSK